MDPFTKQRAMFRALLHTSLPPPSNPPGTPPGLPANSLPPNARSPSNPSGSSSAITVSGVTVLRLLCVPGPAGCQEHVEELPVPTQPPTVAITTGIVQYSSCFCCLDPSALRIICWLTPPRSLAVWALQSRERHRDNLGSSRNRGWGKL